MNDATCARTAGPVRLLACLAIAACAAGLSAQQLREPLPFDVAARLIAHNTRSPIGLSPDGMWVAHTYGRDEVVPRQTREFAATGFPFAEGDARMQACLSNTQTGEPIRLGGDQGASWAPVWSPDGSRVAYYADDDGEAGLWIWVKATGKTTRFPGVSVRPFFGFENVRWLPDSMRLVCKITPAGMTIAQMNALVPDADGGSRFPKVGPDEPSVFVLKAKAGAAKAEDTKTTSAPREPVVGPRLDRSLADLAILDVTTNEVTRVVERTKALWYEPSPDGAVLACTVHKGWEPNTQQGNFDLVVHDLARKTTRRLCENVRLEYGINVSWSPDGKQLAYITTGQLGSGECTVVDVASGTGKKLGGEGAPNFKSSERPPLWDAAGGQVYALAKDELWRLRVDDGSATKVAGIAGYKITGIVSKSASGTIWSNDGGRTVFVTAKTDDSRQSGIHAIDTGTGQSRALMAEHKSYYQSFNLDACEATSTVAFVAKDQQHLAEVFTVDTRSGAVKQASRLNPDIDRYELGSARLVEFTGIDGQQLGGSLLLPPGCQEGRRYPLVVWVYGGDTGSRFLNSFGFWGDLPTFNSHVLATRGYAVFFPDAPLREGKPMRDLVDTVIPGLNKVIEMGLADPERVAVMGQSYGSYCTLALIAQTRRFKAAVITAVVDPSMLGGYLHMSPDGSDSTGYYEHGQGNMGGTPWQFPERYRENSPVFLFDQIQTPLLIAHGSKDVLPLSNPDHVFVALRRLGKEVEYRIYENEEHVITQKANVIDFWNRRLDFLAEHLDIARGEKGEVRFDGNAVVGRAKKPIEAVTRKD